MAVIEAVITSVVAAVLVGVISFVGKKLFDIALKNAKAESDLKQGVQALLRDRMIQSYNHYQEKGYAPIYAKDNFENMYKPYHNLGENGVMDGIKEDFMEMPSTREEAERNRARSNDI